MLRGLQQAACLLCGSFCFFEMSLSGLSGIDFCPRACPRLSLSLCLCFCWLCFLPRTGQDVAGVDCMRLSRQVRPAGRWSQFTARRSSPIFHPPFSDGGAEGVGGRRGGGWRRGAVFAPSRCPSYSSHIYISVFLFSGLK